MFLKFLVTPTFVVHFGLIDKYSAAIWYAAFPLDESGDD